VNQNDAIEGADLPQGLMEEIMPLRRICLGCLEAEARHTHRYVGPCCRRCFLGLCTLEARGAQHRRRVRAARRWNSSPARK
jgi:hypothetical protein